MFCQRRSVKKTDRLRCGKNPLLGKKQTLKRGFMSNTTYSVAALAAGLCARLPGSVRALCAAARLSASSLRGCRALCAAAGLSASSLRGCWALWSSLRRCRALSQGQEAPRGWGYTKSFWFRFLQKAEKKKATKQLRRGPELEKKRL